MIKNIRLSPEDLFLNREPTDWLQSQCPQWLDLPTKAVSPGHTIKYHWIAMIMQGHAAKATKYEFSRDEPTWRKLMITMKHSGSASIL